MLPNSHWPGWDFAIAAGFLAGLVLFVVSSAMLRNSAPEAKRVTWPTLVDETLADADVDLRLDMIERLSVVPGAWSREILEEAQRQEGDSRVRAAVESALKASG